VSLGGSGLLACVKWSDGQICHIGNRVPVFRFDQCQRESPVAEFAGLVSPTKSATGYCAGKVYGGRKSWWLAATLGNRRFVINTAGFAAVVIRSGGNETIQA